MPRITTLRSSALAVTAAITIAASLSGCGGDAAPSTAPGSSTSATTPDATTPTDEPTTDPTTVKVTGENLLTWKDYSDFGMKGLTVRFSTKPGEAVLSECETSDLRNAAGKTALWQSNAEVSDGRYAPRQQIASFSDEEGASAALASLKAWNDACSNAAVQHDDVTLDEGDAAFWRYTHDGAGSELVILSRNGTKVSYLVVFGPEDLVKKLDVDGIASQTVGRLR